MKTKLLSTLCLLLFSILLKSNPPVKSEFTFIFMTDVHLQPELNAVEGFKKTVGAINRMAPAFIINGGDLIMDANNVTQERAAMLFDLYLKESRFLKYPVYNTLGNHDLFGIDKKSGIDTANTAYGKALYVDKINRRYYDFDYAGWHFFVLDAIQPKNSDYGYAGYIDEEQQQWIKETLKTLLPNKPIVLVTHIPFRTLFMQTTRGPLVANTETLTVTNANQVLDLFKGFNLKLVMQGHLHYYEDLYVDGVRFITGGAVSGNWWKGPVNNIKEGFTVISIKDEVISTRYFEFGWGMGK